MEQPISLFSRYMGRWLMALLLVTLSSLVTRAAQVEVLMGDVGGDPGETVCIPVYVNCDVDMTAFQITFSTDLGVGFSEVGFSQRIDRSATTYCSIDYGNITVLNFGGVDQTSLEAGDGLVMEIYVDIPADAEPGDYTMTLSDIQFQPVGTHGESSLIRPDNVYATLTVNALALEAYACYTPSNTTLTFYYDSQRNTRPGTTYDMNTGFTSAGWRSDGTYSSVTKVVFNSSFVTARPTSTYRWFCDMQNLESITGISYLNTSEVTEMRYMFYNCSKLSSIDVSNFNTAKSTNMGLMFGACSKLTSLDLSSFNTAMVTDMRGMFLDCYSLRTIVVGNGWSTAAVTNSNNMFYNCTQLVGGKGTTYDANHVDMAYAHIDGGPSNPGYFTEHEGPEAYVHITPDGTMTFYYDTFRYRRVLTMGGTDYDLNTGSNYPDWYNYGDCDLVKKVVFSRSFADYYPSSTYCWFNEMYDLESITGMEYLNTSEVTNMAGMFSDCTSLTSIDLSHFNTAKVTDMSGIFFDCYNLQSLDVSSFDTQNVTDMNYMFSSCDGLASLDVSNFNTTKVTDMFSMFGGLDITSLDLSSFNTAKVTNMGYMFSSCDNLRTIYVGSGWSTASVTNSSEMFDYCESLVGGQGTTYNASNPKDKTYAHIDGGPSNPGYFTDKNAFVLGDVNRDGQVNIGDVTTLISMVLRGNASAASNPEGDLTGDGNLNIADVTTLISLVLHSA